MKHISKSEIVDKVKEVMPHSLHDNAGQLVLHYIGMLSNQYYPENWLAHYNCYCHIMNHLMECDSFSRKEVDDVLTGNLGEIQECIMINK